MTKIQTTDFIERVSGASGERVNALMPDCPWEGATTKQKRTYTKLASGWFFEGLNAKVLIQREGIDRVGALNHMTTLLSSWEIGHDEKIDAVAALMFEWFDVMEVVTI